MRRGFTLIELLAAMAILAVVSVMAVQALSGVMVQRSVLTRHDEAAAGLIRALSLLRHDLEATVPLPVGEDDAPAVQIAADRITLRRGGIAVAGGGLTPGFGRVDWALAGGVLTRIVAADGGGDGAAMPLLTGVGTMRLTALGDSAGADLPPGFELMLDTDTWGLLRLVVAR